MPESGSNPSTYPEMRGKKLGRYELLELLSSEGGAETFRARVRGLAGFDRIFAVKCLRSRAQGAWAMSDLFLKTARRSAGITDARVARVLEADVLEGSPIAVSEFIHGIELERFLQCAHLSGSLATGTDEGARRWQRIVAFIGSEVAHALTATHSLTPPLIHGHLCPRNVHISSRAGIKVTDFGLFRAALQTGDILPKDRIEHEAPEYREANATVTSAVDLFSLGSILFELATGEPFSSEKSFDEIDLTLNTHCSALAQTLSVLLSPDPATRPTAQEAAATFSQLLSMSPSDTPVTSELASLVRSFSVFAGTSSLEGSNDLTSGPRPRSQVPSSDSFLLSGDEPTVVRQSGSFSRILALSVPTEPGMPSFIEAAPTLRNDSLPEKFPTLPSTPAVADAPASADAVSSTPEPPSSAKKGQPSGVDSTDWAARALVALGDQAGIQVVTKSPPRVPPPVPSLPLSTLEMEPTEVSPALENSGSDPFLPPLDTEATPDLAPSPEFQRMTLPLQIDAESEGPSTPPPPVERPLSSEGMPSFPKRRITLPSIGAQRSARKLDPSEVFKVDYELVQERRKRILWATLMVLLLGALAGGGAGFLLIRHDPTAPAAERPTGLQPTGSTPASLHPAPKPITPKPQVFQKSAPAAAILPATSPPFPAKKPTQLAAATAIPPLNLAAVDAAKPSRPTLGVLELSIQTQPSGAMVWIEGKERGETPLVLKERAVPVRLTLVKAGYTSLTQKVDPTKSTEILATLTKVSPPIEGEARFRVECATRNKYLIVVDGKETGVLCPFSKMRVAPGIHRIGIFLPTTGAVRAKEVTLKRGVRSIAFPD